MFVCVRAFVRAFVRVCVCEREGERVSFFSVAVLVYLRQLNASNTYINHTGDDSYDLDDDDDDDDENDSDLRP